MSQPSCISELASCGLRVDDAAAWLPSTGWLSEPVHVRLPAIDARTPDDELHHAVADAVDRLIAGSPERPARTDINGPWRRRLAVWGVLGHWLAEVRFSRRVRTLAESLQADLNAANVDAVAANLNQTTWDAAPPATSRTVERECAERLTAVVSEATGTSPAISALLAERLPFNTWLNNLRKPAPHLVNATMTALMHQRLRRDEAARMRWARRSIIDAYDEAVQRLPGITPRRAAGSGANGHT